MSYVQIIVNSKKKSYGISNRSYLLNCPFVHFGQIISHCSKFWNLSPASLSCTWATNSMALTHPSHSFLNSLIEKKIGMQSICMSIIIILDSCNLKLYQMLTTLPAPLLCKLTNELESAPVSCPSRNCWATWLPNWKLSEHPPHSQPPCLSVNL